MMGRLNHDQEQFFCSFRLDEAVPGDHPVREIAALLDLSWVHSELALYYSRLGRPSLAPVLMILMPIIGYVFAMRSERALCRDVRVILAVYGCEGRAEPSSSSRSPLSLSAFGARADVYCLGNNIIGASPSPPTVRRLFPDVAREAPAVSRHLSATAPRAENEPALAGTRCARNGASGAGRANQLIERR
jgi:hypothetical protein